MTSCTSPNEQAAGLLAVLLRQDGGPIILDQPEDDLDNRIVMEVIEKLEEAICGPVAFLAEEGIDVTVKEELR